MRWRRRSGGTARAVFEYWLLRLQGVYPESQGTLSDGAMAFLARVARLGPDRVSELPVERGTLNELEQVHHGLIAMHLEEPEIGSRIRDIRRRG